MKRAVLHTDRRSIIVEVGQVWESMSGLRYRVERIGRNDQSAPLYAVLYCLDDKTGVNVWAKDMHVPKWTRTDPPLTPVEQERAG